MNITQYSRTEMGYKDAIQDFHSSIDYDEEQDDMEISSTDEDQELNTFCDTVYSSLSNLKHKINELAIPVGEHLTEEDVYNFLAERL